MDEKKKSAESLKYIGALSGLIASPVIQGQISYTDIADTTLNTNNAYYDLNLDGDSLGIIDYRFIQYVDTSIFNVSGNFIQSRGTAGNSVMGLDYGNYAYPFNLSPGDSIGPGKPFRGSGGSNSVGQLSLEISDTGHANDKFLGAVNGLIGLRFRADVNDTIREFYGWVRVDVAANYKSITIKDFAVKDQYGEGITAGEGAPWIGLKDLEAPAFAFRQLGSALHFEVEAGKAALNILSLDGKLMHSESFEEGRHQWDLGNLKPGIYLAKLSQGSREEQIRIIAY